jgi:hypothetical protein
MGLPIAVIGFPINGVGSRPGGIESVDLLSTANFDAIRVRMYFERSTLRFGCFRQSIRRLIVKEI